MYKHSFYIAYIQLSLIGVFLIGCHKKDLDEFNSAVLDVNSEVALPLFNATVTVKNQIPTNFTFSDSITLENNTIDLSNAFDFNNKQYTIQDIEFKLFIKNSFPVEGRLQIYFINNYNTVVDSLFTIHKYMVQDASGGTAVISEIYIGIDEERYKKITACQKAKIVYNIKKEALNSENEELFVGCGALLKVKPKF